MSLARFKLLLLLCVFPGLVYAEWTGVALELGNYDSDWKFDNDTREAQISTIDFQIEEKTNSGLRIGVVIGYMDLRVVAGDPAQTEKFDGGYLGVYLRQPIRLTDRISLHGLFDFRYASGNESGDDEQDSDIDWTDARFELGLGLRFANLRLMPFTSYQDIDGDIDNDDGTEVFELDDALSQGIRLDYYVEDTAFVRLEFLSGGRSGGYLSFARRY